MTVSVLGLYMFTRKTMLYREVNFQLLLLQAIEDFPSGLVTSPLAMAYCKRKMNCSGMGRTLFISFVSAFTIFFVSALDFDILL